jgi:iron complex outermembrane receptor protein
VTVVDDAQIQRDAKVSIGDTIRELPAVGSSQSPSNGNNNNQVSAGIAGLDTVNLRQLGANRTLVLLDGQRVVASNITGIVDLGTIPTILVQRVDVVTGGASAAWGSDAVAGVVNLALNKKFDGLRASAEWGDTYLFDHRTLRLQAAAGAGFADGRGRLIVAGNYLDSPEPIFGKDRSWNKYRNLITNPAFTATNDEPRLIHADNTGLSQATNGGLITGPTCLVAVVAGACSRPNPLVNTRFLGPEARLAPFNPGIVAGANSVNGDGETTYAATNTLAVKYRAINLFGYTSFDITDNLHTSLQLNYGDTTATNNATPYVRFGNITIQRDNAFLPESVRQQMVTLGLPTLTVGTSNINIPLGQFGYDNFARNAVGITVAKTDRRLLRAVASVDGNIGSEWTWNAYYQKSQSRLQIDTLSNVITANYNFAVDAVRNASGQVVCRATLLNNPVAAGCVPLNIFGEGNQSQDAIRYVNVVPGQNFQTLKLNQDVVAASAQGKLPIGLPAGQVAVALGAEYRREAGKAFVDAGSAARQYAFANFAAFSGKYDVKEAFLEVDVPLVEDGFVESLNLNAAGRLTDYSTSGTVATWKVGLTSQLNSLVRVRGTLSRDIRAPNLSELFSSGQVNGTNTIDPRTGAAVSVFQITSGNADLTPEIARTTSGGIILSPAPRFNMSPPWFNAAGQAKRNFAISWTLMVQMVRSV